MAAHEKLSATGVKSRVVSLPCFELFDEQPQSYRDSVLPPAVTARVAVESGVVLGWERYLGCAGVSWGCTATAPMLRQGYCSRNSASRPTTSWPSASPLGEKVTSSLRRFRKGRRRIVTMVKYFLILVAVLLAFDTSPAAAGRFRTRGRYANSCTGVRQPVASASAQNDMQKSAASPSSAPATPARRVAVARPNIRRLART